MIYILHEKENYSKMELLEKHQNDKVFYIYVVKKILFYKLQVIVCKWLMIFLFVFLPHTGHFKKTKKTTM